MQKLITVKVDTDQLGKSPNSAFTVNEVDSVNELLELGWEIEQLEILKSGTSDGEIVFLALLNDDPVMNDYDDEFDEEFGMHEDDDDEDDEEEDESPKTDIRPMKKV